jgi:hypothetical protein
MAGAGVHPEGGHYNPAFAGGMIVDCFPVHLDTSMGPGRGDIADSWEVVPTGVLLGRIDGCPLEGHVGGMLVALIPNSFGVHSWGHADSLRGSCQENVDCCDGFPRPS